MFIGLLAIVGVITMQLFMLKQAYMFERKEFAEKIHFALQDVVEKIYRDNNSELPATSPIKKVSDDSYIVNVDDVFEADILEFYLKNEFDKVKLDIDYEYAIYDCASDEMVYGNYITSEGPANSTENARCENCFTKREGLIYYFGIRFPHLRYNYVASLQQYWIYTGVLFLVLVIYVYSVFMLLKQKKYSELQKDFINNMTHEFKTPLSSILIASNYAVKQDEIEKHPKLRKYLQIIIEQSNKLNLHIERILNVAKADTRLMEMEKKEFDLAETLQLVTDNASMKYPGAQITLEVSNKPYPVIADAFHFYNIAYNIVENAIKYAEDNPQVAITVAQKDRVTELRFTDNGPGIPPQHLEYVFDRFYRVPREDRREVEGFGIGLFYVKKICDLHGWKINIRNNHGNGRTITIAIPKAA